MPFALADLGAILFALLMVGIAASIGTLTRFLDGFVPTFRVFGVDVFGWAHRGLEDIHQWSTDISNGVILRLRDMFVDIGHVLKRTHVAQLSFGWNILGLIRHTNNVTVPNAQNAADANTANQVNSARNDAANRANALEGELHQAEGNLQANINTLQNVVVPNAITTSHNSVEADLAQRTATLNAKINALGDAMTADLSSVWNGINALQVAVATTLPTAIAQQGQADAQAVADARAKAASDLAATNAALSNQLAQTADALSTAQANADAANAAIAAADLATAEGRATAVAAADSLAVANRAADALTATQTALQGQINTNAAAIVTLQQTTAITLPGLSDVTIPSSITVPLAVGALAVSVAGIITEIDRCMVSTCEGPNNYANLLNHIMGGIDLAAMVAFLAEIIKDPSGEAKSFASVATGIYHDGHALIDGLLSL